MYEHCLRYTVSAKMAPSWNVLGGASLAKDRDFLIQRFVGTVNLEYKVNLYHIYMH